MPFKRRFTEQAGLGFPAGTTIGFVVWADEDIIQRKYFAQPLVHAIQLSARLISARQTGLIRRRDQNQAGRFELLQQWRGILVRVKILQRQRCDLLLFFNPGGVQDTIPLDKYSLLHTFEKA